MARADVAADHFGECGYPDSCAACSVPRERQTTGPETSGRLLKNPFTPGELAQTLREVLDAGD